jgi:hypothetical protein
MSATLQEPLTAVQRLDLFGGYYLERGTEAGWGMFDPKGAWMHSALCCTWSDRIAYTFMASLSAHIDTHTAMWKRIAEEEKATSSRRIAELEADKAELLQAVKLVDGWAAKLPNGDYSVPVGPIMAVNRLAEKHTPAVKAV